MSIHGAVRRDRSTNSATGLKAQRARVLVVDDEMPIVLGLKRALRDEFEIEGALNGPQALQMIGSKGPFAAVVSDMRMREMDGIEFLSRVRTLAPATTRIMLTGDKQPSTAVQAINKGEVFRFLEKPYPADKLRPILRDGVRLFWNASRQRGVASDLLQRFQHEFRTPLNHIIGFASMIASHRPDNGTIAEYAGYIRQSGTALAYKTHALLTYFALREGVREARVDTIDTIRLIRSCREQADVDAASTQALTNVAIEDDLHTIHTDAELLQLAMTALLSNALKFSPAGATVDLKISRSVPQSDLLCAEIGDRGKGLGLKGDDSVSGENGDLSECELTMGLGVPLASMIAEQLDGRLVIETQPGVGTKARLYFLNRPNSQPSSTRQPIQAGEVPDCA